MPLKANSKESRLQTVAKKYEERFSRLREFEEENEEVLKEYKELQESIQELEVQLKDEARKEAVLGQTRTVWDSPYFHVDVQGKKKWDPELVQKYLPKYASRLIKEKTTVYVDTEIAEALLKAGEIDAKKAEKAWKAETPAVSIKPAGAR